MAVFSSLSERIGHIFSKLSNRGKLTELEIKEAMREIRIALLEADVNYVVVKDLVAKITEKAVGEQILKSLTPTQQVIKIVNEELTALMGSVQSKLNLVGNPPQIILMCGLQGAGKTTNTGKLAFNLKKPYQNKVTKWNKNQCTYNIEDCIKTNVPPSTSFFIKLFLFCNLDIFFKCNNTRK